MKLKQLEKSGLQAIKQLRQSKLKNGLPFMINTKTLPSDQCYLEYPDGTIALVTLSRKNSDFKVITHYSYEDGLMIKKKFKIT